MTEVNQAWCESLSKVPLITVLTLTNPIAPTTILFVDVLQIVTCVLKQVVSGYFINKFNKYILSYFFLFINPNK